MNYDEVVSIKEGLVHGFVQDPNGRGTFTILLSCLAVLFLNTWTVLHLNVPPHKSPLRNYMHKCKWWIIALICSDGLAKTYPWWTMTHGFYAEMGGYRVVSNATDRQTYTFRVNELIWLTEKRLLTVPEVTYEELHDKSNADYLIKGIVLIQCTWFMLQVCARVNQSLPITTLELATVAFIGCTGLMYFFWWHKPMNLETYTPIPDPSLTSENLCDLAREICLLHKVSEWYRPPPKEAHNHGWDWFWFEKPMILRKLQVISKGDEVPEDLRAVVKDNFTAHARVTSWYMPSVQESHSAEWGPWDHLCVFWVGSMFDGIYCAAWKFTFPTSTEATLWRISICSMLGVIYLWVPLAGLTWWLPNRGRLKSLPYWLATLVYFLARIYLLVEVFFGLRAVDRGVFLIVNWNQYIPHAS